MGNILDCGTEALAPLPESRDDTGGSDPEYATEEQRHATERARLSVLQKPTRLKDSLIWDLQRRFYSGHGVGAWSNAIVPNFVTSNAFIARAYANVIAGLVRDMFDPAASGDRPSKASQRSGDGKAPVRGNPSEPVYIVEIGAGHGKLGFLLVTALMAMKDTFPAHELEWPFVYVMTDFTQSNVDAWLAHPQLQDAFAAGVLDVALFNGEDDCTLNLQRRGVTMDADFLTANGNPLVAICNYVFDTLTSDAFRIVDGELREALVTVQSPNASDATTEAGDVIARMACEFSYEDASPDTDFYGDNDFNYIVRTYQERFEDEDASCLVPIGGLRLVRNLMAMARGRLVMLVGDKGYNSEADMKGLRDPHIARHGSFSMMVNFHALGLYFERRGGFAACTPHHDGFKVSLLCSGCSRDDVMHTRWAFDDCIKEFGPENFSTLQRCVKDEIRAPSMQTVLALLRLGRCDADVYYKFKQVLLDKAMYSSPSENVLSDMIQDISGVSGTYYSLVARKDVCFELGRLLMSTKHHREACKFFESSNAFCGEHHVTWHNLGICCYYIDNLPAALNCFTRSLELDPQYADARTWYRKVSTAMVRASSAGQAGGTTQWQRSTRAADADDSSDESSDDDDA